MGINSVSPSERIINLTSGGSSPPLNGTHSDTKDSHCMCLPWVSFRPLHTMKPIIPTRGVHRQSSTNAWESAPPLQAASSVGLPRWGLVLQGQQSQLAGAELLVQGAWSACWLRSTLPVLLLASHTIILKCFEKL